MIGASIWAISSNCLSRCTGQFQPRKVCRIALAALSSTGLKVTKQRLFELRGRWHGTRSCPVFFRWKRQKETGKPGQSPVFREICLNLCPPLFTGQGTTCYSPTVGFRPAPRLDACPRPKNRACFGRGGPLDPSRPRPEDCAARPLPSGTARNETQFAIQNNPRAADRAVAFEPTPFDDDFPDPALRLSPIRRWRCDGRRLQPLSLSREIITP